MDKKWKLRSEVGYQEQVDSYDNEPHLSQSKAIQLKTDRYQQAEADLVDCLNMLEELRDRNVRAYELTKMSSYNKQALYITKLLNKHK